MNSETEFQNTNKTLARRLGLFDAVMIVMGGIIGSGIFMNSYVVALQVHTPALILGAWVAGGLIALAGAFIYAELASINPSIGGQYAYLRDAFHPIVAFSYGWVLLLVIQTGGMAAVSITFATYFLSATHLNLGAGHVATITLIVLVVVNCLGVRAGTSFQNLMMVLKIVAIVAIVAVGVSVINPGNFVAIDATPDNRNKLLAFGAAMAPVLFAFGGWQTATFVSGEMKNPRRDLARGLVIGVIGVTLLYLAVNVVYVGVLGAGGLAATKTPASAMISHAVGNVGGLLLAVAISISTLGFLSQSMLTAPRVYFAMARDGLFFQGVTRIHPKSRVPFVAIIIQGAMAALIANIGRYDAILNYVVSMDFIAFGLTATTVFVFRSRLAKEPANVSNTRFHVPGHPITTILFVAACWLVVISTIYQYPKNTLIGVGILLAGIPVYVFWSRRRNPARGEIAFESASQ